MLWALFGVFNVFCQYVARASGPVFSVLTATVASIKESWVLMAAASTSEGRIYYYDCLYRRINIKSFDLFSFFGLGVDI